MLLIHNSPEVVKWNSFSGAGNIPSAWQWWPDPAPQNALLKRFKCYYRTTGEKYLKENGQQEEKFLEEQGVGWGGGAFLPPSPPFFFLSLSSG